MTLADKKVDVTSPSKLAPLAALGIVFGDIGTSPLYTFKTILNLAGARPDPGAILGALSLVAWTLFLITTVKYVSFAMRVDNDGEGGILALMSLLGVKQHRLAIVAFGLFGAALIYLPHHENSPDSVGTSCSDFVKWRRAICHAHGKTGVQAKC